MQQRCRSQLTGGCSKDLSIIGLDKRAEFNWYIEVKSPISLQGYEDPCLNQDLCLSFADKYHGPSQKQEQLDNKWL